MIAPGFSDFYALPLVGILRGSLLEDLPHLIRAVRNGGMRYLEITMNTPGAKEQIRVASEFCCDTMTIGAGTVTSRKLLDHAISAGARFIVTPTLVREVIVSCASAGIPVFPGAFTPTEVVSAWELAPTMIPAVKIFPADTLGPNYIRALRGPFPNIPLMPTGGVDLATLPEFTGAGAAAFGIGSPLFQKDRIARRDWTWVEGQVRAFVESYRATISQMKAAKP